ncbi:MAG TPA: valine--tRNA ligase [Candidatus Bathyarchaeia archaeon]|nr:valine--tRNA ligase [Candidatus Bathyarchaeia archaeon]
MTEPNDRQAFKPRIKASRWDIRREEEQIRLWEEEDTYRFSKASKKPLFSIDTPPPTASGPWHVAGAAHYAQIDMVARYFRMKGNEVLFPIGIDRNGLPVEVQVERESKIYAHETSREEFIKICKAFLDNVEAQLLQIVRRMGMSCDVSNYYRTDSPEYRSITQATFIEMWRRGLVYEDNRPSNWCPVCRTTIADAEIDYREIETSLNYLRFKVKETGETIIIATTRPELLCTCAAVLFNPDDSRYQHLKGKTGIVPIFSQEVPIRVHSSAKPEFGTGLMMACSYGDYSDLRLFRELNLKGSIAISQEGRMNEVAGSYKGSMVEEARKKIIQDLKDRGLLVKQEKTVHRTPTCWRSENPIEFIAIPEYYLKQLEFLDDIRAIVKKMRFYPKELRQILDNWIDSIAIDWPISRRRFYGTEIPLWFCSQCGRPHVPEPGKYYQPWKEKAPFDHCECGAREFVGEQRTFDTWFDSSISELITIGYGKDHGFFHKAFPASLRPQGMDIVRSWLYYSILRVYLLFKEPAFKGVRLSGMGMDAKGEPMHKSKGNVVYPESMFQKYGADAFRFWSASESRLGSNYRFSEDRVKSAGLFMTKLWNITRFISSFPVITNNFELSALDKMMLAQLNEIIRECTAGYEELDMYVPANAIRDFAWSIFADHYVEAAKSRAYNQNGEFDEKRQRGAWYTLHTCLGAVLKLLAPICPFATEALWREVYSSESIHVQPFPTEVKDLGSEFRELLPQLMEFDTAVWKFKKERNTALSQGVSAAVYAPAELKVFEADLKAMHKIRDLYFGEPPKEIEVKAKALGNNTFAVE